MALHNIPLTKPSIREGDIEAVRQVLLSGMLVQAKNVETLEHGFTRYLKVPHAAALSNGTATLHLALIALGIGKGDEVIVPAFSYVATANVVELTGAKSIFVDVEPDTFNISVKQIERSITSATKAIIPVHEFGLACNIREVMAVANNYKLPVIEDAACALGATQNDRPVGSFGIAGSFSLHPRKAITSGEGGVLVSGDAGLINKVKVLRNHGMDGSSGKPEFVAAGYNYRMTDFQAALVSGQLERLDGYIEMRNKVAAKYTGNISNSAINLPVIPSGFNHTWQSYHVILSGGLDRNEVIGRLKEQGVQTNYGAQCIPAVKYYADKYKLHPEKEFPNAWRAYTKGLCLPMFDSLTDDEIDYVIDKINKI